MLRNYLLIAWRNIRKNRGFSAINLLGLSVGITAFIMIALYISDELKYDKFLKDLPQVYQVTTMGKMGGQEFYQANHPPPVGNALKTDFQGIETYARIYRPRGDVMISYQQTNGAIKSFTEKRTLAVDSNFFEVLAFPLLEGDPKKVLQAPHTIVLTEEMAVKYFGKANAVGEMVAYGDSKVPHQVTGVLKNIPAQSSLQFDFLVPMQTYPEVKRFDWSWVWLQVYTYVKVSPALAGNEKAIRQIEDQTPAMIRRHGAKGFERIGQPLDDFYKNGGYWFYKLQPYSDVHLGSAGITNDLMKIGNKRNLYIFGVIALFIVLLACVNFMNLSTARSFNRARETGVRKVMGSTRKSLIFQFLTESFVYSLLAMVIAVVLLILLLPVFNLLAEKKIEFADLFKGYAWLLLLGITFLSGVFAGSYPAFYLSSFKPVKVLKGEHAKKGGNHIIRNSLVVFQFGISVVLIICTAVVLGQLNFMQGKELGLDKENLLVISNSQRLGNNEQLMRDELAKNSGISHVAITTDIPSGNAFGDTYIPENSTDENPLVKDMNMYSFLTDEDFIPSMNIRVTQGRNFSKEYSDSASVIINETAARQIGWKNPVGKWLRYPGGDDTRFQVIGVVKDFAVQSFREVMVPFALFHQSSKSYNLSQSYMVIRIKPQNIQPVIATLESKWKTLAPGTPLDYNFLDARINQLYQDEERMSRVFLVFAVLSILVACLGLFGLSAFAAEQRTKEIGIRKVLGASVGGIVQMLSRDFLKLVVIGSVIAFPIAWWAMGKWLEDFAYRISIGWGVFLLAAGLSLIIALITVSFQALKAAVANPVTSLRSE